MELRVLKYFLMVAREQNITKAAQLLHITQPTLSRQLMQLEEELGITLFDRSQHQLHLTDEGILLQRCAQEMIYLEEKIKDDFSSSLEELSGTITIGCGEASGMKYVSKVVSDFSKIYSKVKFEILTADSDTIKNSIEGGTVDIGLLIEPVDITKYNFKRVEKERWGILVTQDSPLSKKSVVEPKDLVNERLLIANRTMVMNELENWLGNYYQKDHIVAYYNLGYNLVQFIKNKMGIAFCLESIDEMRDLVFIPLSPQLETRLVMVWKKDSLFAPAMKGFMNYIDEYE